MCRVDGCANKPRSKHETLCHTHYYRLYRHGDVNHTSRCPPNLSIMDKPGGCWEFAGRKNKDGYGQVKHNGTYAGAHRWAYLAWVGTIPAGHVVRHKCDNPPCINPEHLETGTQADNVADAVAKGRNRTHRNLTTPQVERIEELVSEGWTHARIESMLNLSSGTVSKIMSGQLYLRRE